MDEPLSPPMAALEEAITAAGGVGALAARIGVATSAPSMWRVRGRVPAEHCPAIERETAVRCERLRPDVAWDVLRMQCGQSGEGEDRRTGDVDRRTGPVDRRAAVDKVGE